MANQDHLDILKQGMEVWNGWRKQSPDIEPDLSDSFFENAKLVEFNFSNTNFYGSHLFSPNFYGADLKKADLSYASLENAHFATANLSEAKLYRTRLEKANFFNAHLNFAYLSFANLEKASFYGASLREADLTYAYVSEANFSTAQLSNAHLANANFYGADFTDADLSRANLRNANLKGARLVRTNMREANLMNCQVYGISAWDVQLEDAIQDNLVITLNNQPTISVDNLKVAQFLYLLLNYEEIRSVLNSVTERGVLLLGRFRDGGLELLQSLAAKLREMKYLPMIFDFDRPDNRDYTETVKTLVGLSRFVIVDLSGPSVPQELYATVPHFDIPFVTIIEEGREPHFMFRDLLKYPWVFTPLTFANKEQLIQLLPSKVLQPAEEKCQARQAKLKQLFKR